MFLAIIAILVCFSFYVNLLCEDYHLKFYTSDVLMLILMVECLQGFEMDASFKGSLISYSISA